MKYLALDIGATEIKSAIFDSRGLIITTDISLSYGVKGARVFLEAINHTISRYKDFSGIGVACTGQIDAVSRSVVYANRNVEGLTGTHLGDLLEKRWGVPVTVENDANAAAVGEGAFGAAMDEQDYLCVTFGTGIGGAIVVNNELVRGHNGVSGELGHIITHVKGRECACGNAGCYEQYASVNALMKNVHKIYPEIIDGRALFANIDKKPQLYGIVNEWIDEVSYGLVSLTHIYNPPLIVLCGGIMTQPYILEQLKRSFIEKTMKSFLPVKIVNAKLGNLSGVHGAFLQILQRHSWKGELA